MKLEVQRVNTQEIYLIERYISPEYLGELRDMWDDVITHIERCLVSFMQRLPADYRGRPIPQQPDIVWGEHVLPNFRGTRQGLMEGYIKLSHGDLSGLTYAHGPLSDFRGQMEFLSEWMGPVDEAIYGDLLHRSTAMAANIVHTYSANWKPYDLSSWYDDSCQGPLKKPLIFPSYRVSQTVKVASGDKLPQPGIYVPDLEHSCAQFLTLPYTHAPEASVLVSHFDRISGPLDDEMEEEPEFEKRPCIWRLVERITDTAREPAVPTLIEAKLGRIEGGATCPETGYYFTPARSNSRRKFLRGEPMPDFGAAYGSTIWQWDSDQR